MPGRRITVERTTGERTTGSMHRWRGPLGPALAIGLMLSLGGCQRGATGSNTSKLQRPTDTQSQTGRAKYAGLRPVYPWSVVPGGVDSPEAMRNAIEEDPVVKEHYAGLDPGKFRAQVLPNRKQAYVSYRIRDKVYWTSRLVTLQAGETVLSDGQAMVRGRCGNLVATIAQTPVAPIALEPAEVAMDMPVSAEALMESAPMPNMAPVAAELFVNPMQLGDNPEASRFIPPPDPEDALPPTWFTGGIPSPGGGIMASSPPSSTPPASNSPDTPTPPTRTPEIEPRANFPGFIPSPPIEVAPPMVLTPLIPEPPSPPPYIPFLPPAPFHPPTIQYPPPYSPPGPPPGYFTPPGGTPPPPGPPPPEPPPTGPPPGNPPPGGPPPSDPPPPPLGPPPSEPPPLAPPPDVSVPEPGAWVLFALGIAGIAIGSYRRKT